MLPNATPATVFYFEMRCRSFRLAFGIYEYRPAQPYQKSGYTERRQLRANRALRPLCARALAATSCAPRLQAGARHLQNFLARRPAAQQCRTLPSFCALKQHITAVRFAFALLLNGPFNWRHGLLPMIPESLLMKSM